MTEPGEGEPKGVDVEARGSAATGGEEVPATLIAEMAELPEAIEIAPERD